MESHQPRRHHDRSATGRDDRIHGEPPTANNGEGDAPEVDVTDLEPEEIEDGVEVDDRP